MGKPNPEILAKKRAIIEARKMALNKKLTLLDMFKTNSFWFFYLISLFVEYLILKFIY